MDLVEFEAQAGPPPDHVIRPAFLFRSGDYPDRRYSMTPDELQAAAADFAPVPIDLQHTPTVLDGKLGQVQAVEARGAELFGSVAVPAWLNTVLGPDPIKVSCAWDRATKRLQKVSLVTDGRVDGAALMAAFAAAAGNPAELDRAPTGEREEIGMSSEQKKPSLWARFWGAADEGERQEMLASIAPPGGQALMSATPPAPDPRVAELQQQLATAQETLVTTQAAAFADNPEIKKRWLPADRDALLAVFGQAVRDDFREEAVVTFGAGKQGNRADALLALLTARPPHRLTEELLPAGGQVLANQTETAEFGQADTPTTKRMVASARRAAGERTQNGRAQ